MSQVLRTLLSAAALASVATAQQLPQPTQLSLRAPIHAGTYHVASGQFVPAAPGQQSPAGTNDVIFKSNYYSAFFYDIDDGTVVYDEGRIPSTSSPSPIGTSDSYRVNAMQIAYATDSTMPVSMRVRIWHSYDTCSDPSLLPAPIANIAVTNMPGTINPGAFTAFSFDIDLTGVEFCMLADGDGIYNEGGVQGDRFGFSLQVLDDGNGTQTGPIVGVRPGTAFAPTGEGTVFFNPGTPVASGLGVVDQWYDVEASTPLPLTWVSSVNALQFVDISLTGTPLVFTPPANDDGEANFTSTVGNVEFPAGTVRVGANGGVRFGSATGDLAAGNIAIPATGGTIFGGGNVLLPFWDDLHLAPFPGSGEVYWQEIAGVLYIQWNNVTRFIASPAPPSSDRLTFQIQIPSTGNTHARFVYSNLIGSAFANGSSATIGRQVGTAMVPNQPFSFNMAGAVMNGTVLSLNSGSVPGAANCFNWGGYNSLTNNPPFGSFWLVLEADPFFNCASCAGGIDDVFEPNDTCVAASNLGVLGSPVNLGNLIVSSGDEDHYEITLPVNGALTARVDFTHSQANVNLQLLALNCTTVLASSTSTSNSETVRYVNCGPAPIIVNLRVHVLLPAMSPPRCAEYALSVTSDASCATDDLLEDNDSCGQAVPLALGFTPNMRIKPCDEDYYFLDADPGETVNLAIFFTHAVADIDLFLYRAGATCGTPAGLLAQSISVTNDEFITWTNTTGQVQNYVMFVDFFGPGTSNCSTYQIAYTNVPSTEIGFQFCTAELNSTGRGAHIFATGSDVAADLDVTLGCRYLPMNSSGYFLNNRTNVFVPHPGVPPSVGNLCIAGGTGVGRYNGPGQVLNTLGGSQVVLTINLLQTPRPTGFVPILAGQTWYFQYWYRDIGPVNNFSDAVGIMFL